MSADPYRSPGEQEPAEKTLRNMQFDGWTDEERELWDRMIVAGMPAGFSYSNCVQWANAAVRDRRLAFPSGNEG